MRRYKKTQKNRNLFIRRTIIVISIILILALLITGAILLFYTAIDDGEEFYPENTSSTSASASAENPSESSATSSSSVAADKGDFSVWNDKCSFNMIVVNKNNSLPSNFDVDMVDYKGFMVDKRIEADLNQMITDASSAGIDLWISSAYRSVKLQAEILDNEIYNNIKAGKTQAEAEAIAKSQIAIPGQSEHHTGLAIDFNGVRDDFYTTDAYKWLSENAKNYGFILRYPESKKDITGIIFEPWHFRYVGKDVANAMSGKDICLEEYVDSIKNK